MGPGAATCQGCGQRMARHYCSICRLWDDEEQRSIYHCPFCNLCRLGKGLGVDACHCMRCNACMHLSEYDRHKCRDLSTCPVCTEYLFDSKQPYRVCTLSPAPTPANKCCSLNARLLAHLFRESARFSMTAQFTGCIRWMHGLQFQPDCCHSRRPPHSR